MKIEELIKQVGKPYVRYDEQGLASGCMAPVFCLYPNVPRYDWPEDETQIGPYMEELFNRHADLIALDEIQPGDILLVQMFFDRVHPGIFIGNGKMIHCLSEAGWEIMRFSHVRVKGGYRVCPQAD